MKKYGKKNKPVYTLSYSKSFQKSLKKIPEQDIDGIREEIENLKEDPYKKLTKIKDPNIKGTFRTRKGNYRIFLDINGTTIQIHCVKDRKEAYLIK